MNNLNIFSFLIISKKKNDLRTNFCEREDAKAKIFINPYVHNFRIDQDLIWKQKYLRQKKALAS